MGAQVPWFTGALVRLVHSPLSETCTVQRVTDDGNVVVCLVEGSEGEQEFPADSIEATTILFKAEGWTDSVEKACNVRSEPDLSSEVLSTKEDGSVVRINGRLEGFLKLADEEGWVREQGEYCGLWTVLGGDAAPAEDEAKETAAKPAAESEGCDTEDYLQKLKDAFLEGGDLEAAMHDTDTPCRGANPAPLQGEELGAEGSDDGPPRTEGVNLNTTLPQDVVRRALVQEEAADVLVTPRPDADGLSAGSGETPTAHNDNSREVDSVESPAKAWASPHASQRPKMPLEKKTKEKRGPSKRSGHSNPASPSLDPELLQWLKANKLSSYAQTFQAHEVDLEVLPSLTYADLMEMRLPSHVCKAIKTRAPDRSHSVPPAMKAGKH